MRKRSVHLLAYIAVLALPLFSAESDPLEAQVARMCKLAGAQGVCCIIGCSDNGAIAAAIARSSSMLVFAVDENPEKVASARETARRTNLLGSRLQVDAGSAKNIPLTNDYADLLLISELDDAALQKLNAAEVARVLAPRFGVALVGRASWMKGDGKLTRNALQTWCAAMVGATIQEDADGLFAVIRKPAKVGADNWSYWNHGADNNAASKDTAYKNPEIMQWLSRPFQTGWSILQLAAGGRVFLAFAGDRFSGNVGWPRYAPVDAIECKEHQLHCFHAYNGRLLWTHPLPRTPWFGLAAYEHSIWVATDDRFYLAEIRDVVTLDAANGKEVARFPATTVEGQQVLWLAVQDDIAYALIGNSTRNEVYGGKRIIAAEAGTGKLLWSHDEPTTIDAHALALSGGRVFLFAGEQRAVALDARTGKELWSNEKLNDPEAKPSETSALSSSVVCSGDVLSVLSPKRGVITLSAKDGSEMWRHSRAASRAYGRVAFTINGEKLITNSIPRLNGFNLQTGEPLTEGFGFSGCGRLICTPSYTIGQLGTVFDPLEKKVVTRQYMKPFCPIGNIVGNGMRYSAPHWCRCLSTFRGMLGFSTRTESDKIAPQFPLEAANLTDVPVIEATPADWTQYRRDDNHGGSSPVSVGQTAPAEVWRYTSRAPAQLTAAIAVGDIVVVGGSDGSVQCIDAKSGKQRWEFMTAGKIFFPPTFADNRIYVGSSDGRVYCLAAATGEAQWRFRAAPDDRRLLVYDQMLSRWPVNTNLIVNNGAVYAVAGLIDTDGVYVHGLDARTGKLKWTNNSLGATEAKRIGVMPVGAMTLAKGRLWLRTDQQHPSFNLETGQLAGQTDGNGIADDDGPEDAPAKKSDNVGAQSLSPLPPPRERTSMGMDLGVIAGKYLLDGGRRLYSDQSDRTQRCDTFVQSLNEQGTALYPRFMIASRTSNMPLMPVWDDDLVIERPGGKVTAIELKEMLKTFATVTALDKGVLAVTGNATPQQKWSKAGRYINGLALSKDAVLVLDGTAQEINPGKSFQKTRFSEWHLVAMNRETGDELWRVKLPEEPLYDSITIDRNGRIIVVCVNGTVVCFGR